MITSNLIEKDLLYKLFPDKFHEKSPSLVA